VLTRRARIQRKHRAASSSQGRTGTGKTTFAQEFLPRYAKIVHFVNADMIASGLSPFDPQLASIQAGRLVLSEIDRRAAGNADFAIESTLSGLSLLTRLKRWKKCGYAIDLALPSREVALRRIALRVQQGGHGIPKADVIRRFSRSWNNFEEFYKPIADF